MTVDSGQGTDTGGMDMKEHLKTWSLFLGIVKWIIIGNAILFTFLFFFRTHN